MRPRNEKPAQVLVLIYTLGWLPALAAAVTFDGTGYGRVVSGAGEHGVRAALGLGAAFIVLTWGYFSALRHPPSARSLACAVSAALTVAIALPTLWSADVYAYAYYGDLALHGRTPYGHVAVLGDPLARAAIAAWNGRIPPRCVYGPLAVIVAALADLAGAAAGVSGQILAQRLAAVAAYLAGIPLVLRLVDDRRARAALLLNPIILWSVAEGHNDALALTLAAAGLLAVKRRVPWLTAAALVKIPALSLLRARRRKTIALALAATAAGYAPLAFAVFNDPAGVPAGSPAAWQSPLGLLAAVVGRPAAVGLALVVLAGFAGSIFAARRLGPVERTAAIALSVWFTLPNAYPWYALWLIPCAIRQIGSMWSSGLIVASLSGASRAMTDGIFPASSTFTSPPYVSYVDDRARVSPRRCFLLPSRRCGGRYMRPRRSFLSVLR